jgi:hypothetical protein
MPNHGFFAIFGRAFRGHVHHEHNIVKWLETGAIVHDWFGGKDELAQHE